MTIVVKGTRWHYEEGGSGRPVILLHGNLASSFFYSKVMDIPGLRCVAPDLPNFGRSGPLEGEISFEAYADALADFMEAMGLAGAPLVGHSLGGTVGLMMAARHPGLISALLLVDSSSPEGIKTPPERFPLYELMRTNRDVLAQAFRPMVPTLDDEAFFQKVIDEARLMDARAWVGHAVAYNSFDLRGKLEGFAKPVLVLWGRKDVLVTEANARDTAAAFPAGRLEIVEQVGHSLMVEDPRLFREKLSAFVSELR